MNDLSIGIKSFFEGLNLFKNNSYIRNLSLIPIFLCILLLTFGMGTVVLYIDDLLSLVAAEWMANLNVYLKNLIYILASLAMFIVVYFIVLIVVSILAIPVCEKITNKIFELRGARTKDDGLGNLTIIWRVAKASIAKLILVIVVSIFILIATFIPIFYPIAMYLTFMLVTWDVLDFSFDKDGNKTFKERIGFIKENWLALTGFSLCLGLLLFIPLIHFILLPVAVCGAACLYLNIRAKRSEHDSR